MSVATEISRLQTAKASIKTAMEAKNLTVPSSTKIDGYSAILAQLGTLVPTPGDYPIVNNSGMKRIAATSLTSTGIDVVIPVAGTYRLKWMCVKSTDSGTFTSRLYRKHAGGSFAAVGSTISTWTDRMQNNSLDLECEAGDTIRVYLRSSATDTYNRGGNLSACVAQKLFF